jgi:arylsulfatase A-like enzyme
MPRIRHAKTGAAVGAKIGLLAFAADLAGAFLAIGALFDPRPAALAPILVAAVSEVVVFAIVGASLGLAWPASHWPKPGRRLRQVAFTTLAVVVCLSGYAVRRGHVAPPLPSRPPLVTPRPESVLWITVDTYRADYVFGPNLDFHLSPALGALADQSLVFTDAEAASGWTLPSLATVLTGIHPETLQSARRFLPEWAPLVAERMRAAGYATTAIIDNALLEHRNGFAQGFERWRQRSTARFVFSLPGYRFWPLVARHWLRELLPIFYEGSPGVTDAALAVISEPRETPLFLYVHYMDTHYPYYRHPENGPEPDGGPGYTIDAARQRADERVKPTAAQLTLLQHRYAGEVKSLDRDLTRLLEAWQTRFGANSMIMVTGDHGEEFMEHGALGHGQSLYRELVHVPLIIKPPARLKLAFPQGSRITTPVGHVDVLPTTLDMLDLSPNLGADGVAMQGVSWLPWLEGRGPPPDRPLFASQSHSRKRIYRWREGNWVMLTTYERNKDMVWELYDLANDPSETRNIFWTEYTVRAELAAHAEPFMQRQEAERDPRPVQNAESLETLKALGYVE